MTPSERSIGLLRNRLIDAIDENDSGSISEIVDELPPRYLSVRAKDGMTVLHWAAKTNNPELASKLIAKLSYDALISTNDRGETALYIAAHEGNSEIARELIEQMTPKDLTIQASFGGTALYCAAAKGCSDIAYHLIDKMRPADLALQTRAQRTVLHAAIIYRRTDIALKLIEKMNPQSLLLKTDTRETALKWAKDKGLTDVAAAIEVKMPSLLGRIFQGRPVALVENKSSAVSSITKPQPIDVNWNDLDQVREAIAAALQEGRAGQGLDIAEPFLMKCREFLDTVLRRGQDSLTQFAAAQGQIRKISDGIKEYHGQIQKLSENPQNLIPADDLKGKVVQVLRQVFPSFDPMNALQSGHTDTLDLLDKAYVSSSSLIRLHEDLDTHYPDIDQTLSELESVILQGVKEAEAKAAGEADLHEKEKFIRLKKTFEGVANEVHGHRGLMRASHQATGIHIDTEIEFINSLRQARTAIGALNLNRSFIVAQLKQDMAGQFTQEAESLLQSQLQIADGHLQAIQSALSTRKNGVESARIVLIEAQSHLTSSPALPQLSAA